MDEEMNACEVIKKLAEENQTRKILAMLKESKDLDEALRKTKALLGTE